MIHELLAVGAANAQSGKSLARILNMGERAITVQVERERREGHPICATCDGKAPGYYLAASKGDMAEYCKRLHHRAGEIQKTRKACLGAMASLPD